MITLPELYQEQMRKLLGAEYEAWFACFMEESKNGLRVNSAKITADRLRELLPVLLTKVPWISNGYTYAEGTPSRDACYFAGLYYLQEPSAMTPAEQLAPEPGDYVLDLCAAPGGKATELGARLKGKGILVANDISASRANALLKNLELAGIPNIYVTAEKPDRLKDQFPDFFDKILVDAPCSGEGMFRKDPHMIQSWMKQGPESYAPIQREIICQAADMLRPGGKLLYSTCTFSPLENEGTIQYLLEQRPCMHLVPLKDYEGFAPGLQGLELCRRIYPHHMKGEGHFLALLQKDDDGYQTRAKAAKTLDSVSWDRIPDEAKEFLCHCDLSLLGEDPAFRVVKDKVYAVTRGISLPRNLRYLRTGWYLGECKKGRFEPSQALAMVLRKEQFDSVLSFSHDDGRVIRYLKGETLDISDFGEVPGGWKLICMEEFPLGWGKSNRSQLKNKYYAGWRWQ